jgi:FkbM family methyltransferase
LLVNFAERLYRRLHAKQDKRRTDYLKTIKLPTVMQKSLGKLTASFEAVVPDDPVRIEYLCGEEEWWNVIVKSLRPDDCFCDVGSFTGLLAVYAAKVCSAGKVLAIEPDPRFCGCITENAKLNNLENVVVMPIGLSDENGVLKLNTSGVDGWAPSFYSKNLKEWIEVDVKTLDSVISGCPEFAPSVIKIDVEGFEAKVLRGATSVLRSPGLRLIFLELHPVFLYQNNETVGQVLSYIESAGFKLKEVSPRKNEIHIAAVKTLDDINYGTEHSSGN